MFNNTVKPFTNDSFSLCSLDGVARERSSVLYAVTLSATVITAILSPVAVAGNALIITAIWKNPSLKTPTYVLLRFLAFTYFLQWTRHPAFLCCKRTDLLGKTTEQSPFSS